MIRDVRNNSLPLPVSEFHENLKGKGLPDVTIQTFRRIFDDMQSLQRQIQEVKVEPVVTPPAPVLTTFTELTIGSPADAASGAVRIRVGRGTPEAIVQGSAQRDIWFRTDGAAGTFCYAKETGTDTKTGWVAKF